MGHHLVEVRVGKEDSAVQVGEERVKVSEVVMFSKDAEYCIQCVRVHPDAIVDRVEVFPSGNHGIPVATLQIVT